MNTLKGDHVLRYFRILTIVSAMMSLPSCLAFAQGAADYPSKPIRVISSSAPGGGGDTLTRLIAQKLSEQLQRQIVVDNRPGAGDTIAFVAAAKSAPDGYTLVSVSPSFTIAPALYPDFPYDPLKDYAPVGIVARAPLLLAAHPALPAKSVKELIALAKAKPGALDVGIAQGSISHLVAAFFASTANIKVTFIPYKATAPLIIDGIGGQIHLLVTNALATLPHVRSGRLRALAVTTGERFSLLPELPTISESGVRGYDASTWNGWLAPAGTPPAIVNRLSAELAKSSKSADVAKKLADDATEPVGSTPEQFQQLIASELPRWRKVVKDLGLRVE